MGTSISFAVTCHDEHVELNRLLQQLSQNISPDDEIVIQLDTTSTPEVEYVVDSYPTIKRVDFDLNGDFASFKNNLKSHCSKDWIFFIDADEYLSDDLLEHIHEVLDLNQDLVDVIAVPRINTVDGLTEEHIYKWKWFVNENGWVNYPDYQTRICVNKPEIQWIHKLHERLANWKTIATLPEGYDLIHPKTIERQEKQNNFYNNI